MAPARARRPSRGAAIAACAAVLIVLAAVLHGGGDLTLGALYLTPPLALATVLFWGRYPGHRRLLALSRRPGGRRAHVPVARKPVLVDVCSAGRVVCEALAGRAPPLAAGRS